MHLTEEVTVLFTEDRNEISQFTQEARNCAALDTCCSSSVSGKDWLEMYLDAIEKDKLEQVRGPLESNRIFKFGNNGRLNSLGKYFIPAVLAGQDIL